jgi:hypothetical protein
VNVVMAVGSGVSGEPSTCLVVRRPLDVPLHRLHHHQLSQQPRQELKCR